MNSKKLAAKIADLMLEKKGSGIIIMDLRKLTNVTDFFVICSASSDIQVKSIADHVKLETKKEDEISWHNEGYTSLSWILLDYVNVVAHVFKDDLRKFYNLEGLWADAEVTVVKEDEEKK
ncbi:MAG TPA: ribosome silencing factor [Ignavibacteria bacterium]|nr:ribosome silencing factor [Ignavibacteria bacterium]